MTLTKLLESLIILLHVASKSIIFILEIVFRNKDCRKSCKAVLCWYAGGGHSSFSTILLLAGDCLMSQLTFLYTIKNRRN